MANGLEDLKEKNKDRPENAANPRYRSWRTFQGREDAEMLREKNSLWSSAKDSKGEYDSWSGED